MSINYYWLEDGKSHCNSCECHERVHIGKSSIGWKFLLHLYSDRPIESLEEWKILWELGRIEDEYGRKVEVKEMLEIIDPTVSENLKAHNDYGGYGLPVPIVVEGELYDTWSDVDFT